ncbi:hypothetical protein HMPREF0742_01674 [Rothia aeria F0184]|uniref:Uncharacterized protein n=1 Tax=Rothia aeria F0184 TaxID=888019 RepID=U7V2L7_9MICC|nr:hypothetical protein HMPREF0742_01674 [Rothia aeria F0184]
MVLPREILWFIYIWKGFASYPSYFYSPEDLPRCTILLWGLLVR